MIDDVPMKGAPLLAGLVIAAAVAVVATGICMVVFKFNIPQATFVAAVLFVVVGLILGLPSPAPDRAVTAQASGAATAYAMPAPPMAAQVTSAPVMAAPAAPTVAARRPQGMSSARNGMPDDLKIIKGIGPALEKLCHSLGYYHFDQIAAWTAEEIAWVDDNLEGFKGRVTRDEWVAQARVLAAGRTIA